MTIAKTASSAKFVGNGVATSFSLPFYVAATDTLALYLISYGGELTRQSTSGFSFVGNATAETTTVTFLTAPAADVGFWFFRETPGTQLVSIKGQVSYNPTNVERVWDKLTKAVQEVQEGLRTAVRGVGAAKPFVPQAGAVIIVNDDLGFSNGPTATQIEKAQESATLAQAWAADAAASATAAALFDPANYQPKDATLTGLAALPMPAGRFPYTTGTDTFAAGAITAAGRALLDDADAAEQRATLGLGDYLAISTKVTNFDTIASSGVVWANPGATGCPEASPSFVVITEQYRAGWMRQTACGFDYAASGTDSHSWMRVKSANTWGAWQRIRQTEAEIKSAVMNASGAAPTFACRAWVCFDGFTGTIRGGGNVSIVTRDSTGDWWITFQTPMPHANYCVVGMSRGASGQGGRSVMVSEWNVPLTTSVRVINRQGNVNFNSDSDYVFVAVFC